MLKLGIEPKTFALLARRSNQLSYSSTTFALANTLLLNETPNQEFITNSDGGVLSVPDRPLPPGRVGRFCLSGTSMGVLRKEQSDCCRLRQ